MRWLSLALTALVACDIGSPSVDGDVEETLTRTGGCADLYVYAVDADDAVILEVWFDGPIEAAAGVDTSEVFSLPDAGVEATLSLGDRVSDIACDDVAENGGPQIEEVWGAVAGEAFLEIVHSTDADPKADVELTDVVFESPDGETIRIETFSWSDITVGWFAG